MAKQLNKINVNLEFNANTEKAKAAFMDLNRILSNLQNQNLINPDNGIRQAAQDARELQNHLSKAVNVDTGRLDLNRFSNSLKSSNKELKDYYNSLMKLGDQGEQAFMQLSRSIATAETSTVRVNKRMQEFAVTLKNAARWQISSSILHGFMGAIQSAYGYAKDLDSALNDIRIVTGASADEIDRFAIKANQAAKALSTTTTEYAKASLIYFQQGLNDSEVKARTNITIKMANAAGASAEKISDQLTAVWNNFYDGSQSLDHFADAMVRLGADTASSSDEIAAGLEKFASIGSVIGLGFDEAASALATVTAQTRQSAEIVGTAFKTIFARIQGLNLGETLEDGTTLNKYSEALAKVGISIKNEYGGIKDMNTLLDEMGEKWNLISKDQQIALAQAVGGVRQYNQIVALMDNYDFYQQNLNAAKGADGSLEEQAAVYAESWEASEDRVRAAAEGVYDSLINEDFFIEFNNNLSILLEGVEGLIDGFGGMEGVLSMVGSLALRYFAKDIPSALSNTKDNVIGLLGLDSKGGKKVQKDNDDLTNSDYLDNTDPTKKIRVAQIEGTKTLNAMNQQLNANLKNLSAEEKVIYETKIKQVEKDYELLELQGRELEQEEKTTKELQNQIAVEAAKKKIKEQAEKEDKQLREQARIQAENEIQKPKGNKHKKDYAKYEEQRDTRAEEIYQDKKKEKIKLDRKKQKENAEDNNKKLNELKAIITQEEKLITVKSKFNSKKKSLEEIKGVRELKKNTLEFVDSLKEVNKESESYKKLKNILEDTNTTIEKAQQAFEEFENEITTIDGKSISDYERVIEDLREELEALGMESDSLDKLEEQFRQGAISTEQFETSIEQVRDSMDDLPGHTVKASEAIAELGSGIMGLVGMASGIENLFDTFNDEDASAIQKISAAMGGLMTAGTAVSGMYKSLDSISKSAFIQKIKEANAIKASATATTADAAAKVGLAGASKAAAVATNLFSKSLMGIPVLGWIATAITVVVGAITALVSAEQKAIEERAELAKESKELADTTYEEVEANKELRNSFDDTLASYKEGKIEKNELINATEELCNKYKIENAELLIAAENYDLLTEAIRKAENEKLKAAKKKTSDAKEAAEDVFLDTMYEGTGYHATGDRYIADLQGSIATNFSSDDEKIVKDAVEQLYNNKEISDSIKFGSHGITMETGQSAEELIKLYEEAQKVKEYILTNTDAEARNESEGYQNLVSWLDKSAESYENLIALQGQLNSESVQLQTNNIISKYGEIESQEEYLKAEAELAEKLYKSENIPLDEAKELARQALMAENAYSEMAKNVEIIDQAAKATGGNISKEKLQEKYNSLISDEEKTLFASISFDTIKNEEELDKQFSALKVRAEEYSNQVKIDTIQQAQDNLKSNMTVDDYKDFEKSSGIDWGNEEEGIISYSNFLLLTFEEQTNYLDELEKKYVESSKSTIEAAKLANEELIKDLESKKAEVNKFNIGGQQSDSFTLDDFEKEYIGDSTYNQDLLLKLKTLNPEDKEYKLAKGALSRTVGISEIDLETYISKWKEVQALQVSINNLQKQNDDYNQTDEVNNALELKQQYEDVVNLSKTLAELKIDNTINYEDFTKLGEYLPSLTTNFERTVDGSYKLKESFDNIYISLSALKNDLGEDIFTDFEIAEMIPDLKTLRDAFEQDAITAEAFNTRWAELNEITDLEGLDSEELKDYSKYLQEIADNSEILSNELKNNDKAAKIVAKSIMKMSNGVNTLANGFEDWSSILKKSSKESEEYADAVDGIRSALSDTLDVSEDFISNNFIIQYLNDIEKAATGDAEAIDRLKFALSNQIVLDIIGVNKFEELPNNLQAAITSLQSILDNTNLDIGDTISLNADNIDETGFIEACNNIIKNANMTAEKANAYFDAMGFETTFVTKEQPVTKKGRGTVTVTEKFEEKTFENEDGSSYTIPGGWQTKTYPGEEYEYTDFVDAIAMSTSPDGKEVPKIESITKKASGAFNNFSSLNSGGSNSTTKKSSNKKKAKIDSNQLKKSKEEIERYHEINNELEVLSDNLDDISRKKDKAYGANRIRLINQETRALQEQAKAQQRYLNEIEDYVKVDKNAIVKYGFTFNKDGDVNNYDEIVKKQIQEYNKAYQKYINQQNAAIGAFNVSGKNETDEEAYDAAIEAAEKTWEIAKEKYETFKNELQQYEESIDLLREQENVLENIKNQIQDLNYEKIQYKLEVNLEVNDMELQKIEYYLNKIADDFYSRIEAVQLTSNKIPLIGDALDQYDGYYDKLVKSYNNRDISQENYVEGLKESYNGILDNLEALNDLDKEMTHYYGETLTAGIEELQQYTEDMEQLNSVLDHYQNLVSLLNGEFDYESIGAVLMGKSSNLKNEMDVATSNYKMLLDQQLEIQNAYNNATDENERKLQAEKLKAINEQVDEAHEILLTKTEEWAEAQKSIMENIMAKAAYDMEMAFTDGMGFDALNNSLDRLNSVSDEYLTKTNQIYETQKLINTIQQASDKTTNNAAKVRLKNYQIEIQSLQQKNKLTKLDLDIAKAKYDILLAEIALEEAQNAKSTVRLQRDNEGNYSYVYTADQNKIAQAEQTLLDAQNDLYNIRLEGANDYGQKILELNQQLADELNALEEARARGQFNTDEEYQQAKELLLKEYYDLYEVYSNNYTLAISEDARVQEDAWINSYKEIIKNSESWKDNVNAHAEACGKAYKEYRNTVSTESEVINKLLGSVKDSVNEITIKSDSLKDEIVEKVLPAVKDQLKQVNDLTTAYGKQRTSILDLTKSYEDLAEKILKAMNAQAKMIDLKYIEEEKEKKKVDNTTTTGSTNKNTSNTKNTPTNSWNNVMAIFNAINSGNAPSGLTERIKYFKAKGYSEQEVRAAQDYIKEVYSISANGKGNNISAAEQTIKKEYGFDTGGYTGVWGPEGRLALLHEKEIVLNKQDTENFLLAADILRNVVDLININSLYNQISHLSPVGTSVSNTSALEQQVSIEAHFPNVSDRNEIEEAFNNLINTASQYANRKI